jgi:hypothetical protein
MTITEKQWNSAFSSAFMQPTIEHGDYYQVDTDQGRYIVPINVCGLAATAADLKDYIEGKPLDPDKVLKRKTGWLAQMYTPGFANPCTDWTAHKSEDAAKHYLIETYGDDE